MLLHCWLEDIVAKTSILALTFLGRAEHTHTLNTHKVNTKCKKGVSKKRERDWCDLAGGRPCTREEYSALMATYSAMSASVRKTKTTLDQSSEQLSRQP